MKIPRLATFDFLLCVVDVVVVFVMDVIVLVDEDIVVVAMCCW